MEREPGKQSVECPSPSVSVELLDEFKRIYYAEFRERLSDVEALAKATNLVSLFRAIYRPLPLGSGSICQESDPRYNETAQTHHEQGQ